MGNIIYSPPSFSQDVIKYPFPILHVLNGLKALGLSNEQIRQLTELKENQWESLIRVGKDMGVKFQGINIENPAETDRETVNRVLTYVGIGINCLAGVLTIISGALAVCAAVTVATGPTGWGIGAAVVGLMGMVLTFVGVVLSVVGAVLCPDIQSELEYGGHGGSKFRDPNYDPGEAFWEGVKPCQMKICQIDLYKGAWSIYTVIKGIDTYWEAIEGTEARIHFGTRKLQKLRGIKTNDKKSLKLEMDEYIYRVTPKVGEVVDHLRLETTRGQTLEHGGDNGRKSKVFEMPVGGFMGRESSDVINAIGTLSTNFEGELISAGGTGGVPWYVQCPMEQIHSIKIWEGWYVTGMQFTTRDGTKSPIYGCFGSEQKTEGESYREIAFAEGEKITSIRVDYDQWVDMVTINTNRRCTYVLGGDKGTKKTPFYKEIVLDGKSILGFIGRYCKYIDAFGVIVADN